MTKERKQPEYLAEYRKWLVAAEQKSQEAFDKTVLSLSGGALGISFIFLEDVVGPQPILQPYFLLAAWIVWAFSTFAVLTSFYLSHLALRQAISQVDDGLIYKQKPGGVFAYWTALLNATGSVLFLVGVCCITVFAGANLSPKGATNDRKEAAISTTTPNYTTIQTPTNPATNPIAGHSTTKRRLHSSATATATSQK